MSLPTLDVSQRLDRLERELRWWRWGVLPTFAVISLFLICYGSTLATGRIVEAEQFVVKDAAGNVRAKLMVGEDNSSGFILYDDTRMPRVWLAARRASDRGHPVLWLKDENGRTRIALGYHLDVDPVRGEKYVGPQIRVLDENGFTVNWKAP